MMQPVITSLLWFSALGCALLGGLYFSFSAFILTALNRIEQAAGIAAMNSINVVILKSLFMPFFLGTSLASLALASMALFRWGEPGSLAMLSGGILYVVGMSVVTMMFNVPLNNALAAVEPASAEGAQVWARYLKDWAFWNHVRTIACIAASALFIGAIAAR
ncbi:DUF1772 domain-containing protein [Allomesorhizobium alhagi]|nr:anthrone oxygenase family protein [Mesorhizobium alhagi]